MRALCAAFGVEMDGLSLARLCQRVENDVMDAPCGIMDQVTAAFGESGKLLLLLCQPHQVQGTVTLPAGWSVFGIDSGVKHSVAGTAYTKTRIAAFMGFKMLADRAGSGFGGHLCNITPDIYAEISPERLPETMIGGEFLSVHGGIFDSVTSIESGEMYSVRAAAEHAIHENHRVRRFVENLRDGGDSAFREAGIHMAGAHASYSACALGSHETDLLIQLAAEIADVAGAKITGGGSGGTVCVLCRTDAEPEIAQTLASRYEQRTGNKPRLIRGTSPGALATPPRMLAKV
jgi:L-arabinokinase